MTDTRTGEADARFAMLLAIAALAMAFATVLLAHAVLRVHASSWERPAGVPLAALAVSAVLAATVALELRAGSPSTRFTIAALAYATAAVTHAMIARQLRLDGDIAASSAFALTLINAAYCTFAVIVVGHARLDGHRSPLAETARRPLPFARFLAVVTGVSYAAVWLS